MPRLILIMFIHQLGRYIEMKPVRKKVILVILAVALTFLLIFGFTKRERYIISDEEKSRMIDAHREEVLQDAIEHLDESTSDEYRKEFEATMRKYMNLDPVQ